MAKSNSIVLSIVSAVLICIPVGVYLYVGGWVSGEEFSPDDFSHRYFSYNKMPFFGISVRGIQHNDSTPVFEQTLLNDGLIVDPNRAVKRWHLVSDTWSDSNSPDFDARLLCQFLRLHNNNNESIWSKWNEDHPDFAKEFWPIIASLARENLYLDVSELLHKADGLEQSDVEVFRQYALDFSISALNEKGAKLSQDGQDKEAIEVYSVSIDIEPRKETLLARSDCYSTIGDSENSKQDKVAADKLDD